MRCDFILQRSFRALGGCCGAVRIPLAYVRGSVSVHLGGGIYACGVLEAGIEQKLVVHLGLREQNVRAMEVLFAFFDGVAAQLGGLFLLLRFEANLRSSLFGSQL